MRGAIAGSSPFVPTADSALTGLTGSVTGVDGAAANRRARPVRDRDGALAGAGGVSTMSSSADNHVPPANLDNGALRVTPIGSRQEPADE